MIKSFPKQFLLLWLLAFAGFTASAAKLHTPVQACHIFNLVAEPMPCTPNGVFYVQFGFDVEQGSAAGYRIQGNGQVYGTYSYGDNPPVLGPFVGNGQTTLEFIFVDLEFADCQAEVFVGPIDCTPNNCALFDMEAQLSGCSSSGGYELTVDFNYENVQNVGFDLYLGNTFFGFYDYDELPLTIAGLDLSPGEVLQIKACENDNPQCCVSTALDIPACPDEEDCFAFEELTGESFGSNNDTPAGTVILNDNGIRLSLAPFQDIDWTQDYGNVSFPEVNNNPLYPSASGAVAHIEHINMVFNFTQYLPDFNSITLNYYGNLGPFNFSANGAWPLVLFNLTAGSYLIGPGVEMVVTPLPNHPDQGTITFSGNILSLLIGGSNFYLDNLCLQLDTPPCEIAQLIVEAGDCIDGQFNVFIDAEYGNVSDSFLLRINNEPYGHFAYADLPLEIGPFDGPADETWVFRMIDLATPDCRRGAELPPVNCGGVDCHISSQDIEWHIDCEQGDFYSITIDLNYQGVSDSFKLNTLGGFFGTYAYADLPITLAHLPVPTSTSGGYDRLYICDTENHDCCHERDYDLPCVVDPPCEIGSLQFEVSPCTDGGNYFVTINFEHNTPGNNFRLFIDGQPYETYPYTALPITVGPFAGDGIHGHLFKVVDLEGECFRIDDISPVECENNGGDCAIEDFVIETHDCIDGQYLLDVRVFASNPGSEGFLIFANGQLFGPFDYSSNFVTVGPFPGNGQTPIDLLVLDVENPFCYNYLELPAVNCPPQGDCNIGDLLFDYLPCNNEGQFSIVLNFNHQNTSAQFKVMGNGINYGTFSYNDLPVTIGPFAGNGTSSYELGVRDAEFLDCHSGVLIPPHDCTPGEVWPGDADNNNIARNFDLLRLGLAYGAQGPARSTPGIAWQGMQALNWNDSFADGLNFKYADCNGNGVINQDDRVAISENYLETHGPVAPFEPTPATPNDPEIFVEIPDLTQLPTGAVVEAPVILGTEELSVEAIYGLAFTIEYNPQVFEPGSINLTFPDNSWLGAIPSNVITLKKIFAEEGIIEVAMTRINHQDIGGQGPIAVFRGVIDDIAGMSQSEIQVTHIRALRANEALVPLNNPVTPLQLTNNDGPGRVDLLRSIKLFPNPTNDMIYIINRYMLPVESARVLDSKGQEVAQPEVNNNAVSLSNLASGIYILELHIGEYIFHQKVVKF